MNVEASPYHVGAVAENHYHSFRYTVVTVIAPHPFLLKPTPAPLWRRPGVLDTVLPGVNGAEK